MIHTHYLQAALAEAQKGRGFCSPNPAVGAVLVKGNEIIGRGHHQGPGTAHAEVCALSGVDDASGCTLYVTLEPCCHQGRTPACAGLILAKKVSHVIFAYRDPRLHIDDTGMAVLCRAGVLCEHISVQAIDAFYQSYAYSVKHKKPFVTAKLALSFDGKIAGEGGAPVAITGTELAKHTHACRYQSDGILTTAKTIIADDPRLNARVELGTFKKPLFVIDRKLSMPPSARVFETAKSITIFHDGTASINSMKERGAHCVPIVETEEVIKYLGGLGLQDVWVESGATYFKTLLNGGFVNRALIYRSPRSLGDHAVAANISVPSFAPSRVRKMGDDMMMEWAL